MIKAEIIKLQSTVQSDSTCKSNASKWSDLAKGEPGRKAMLIGIILALLNQLCGCFAMLQYTAQIFADAGSSLSPNVSAIFVGVVQLIGSSVATNLVDRAGRKVRFKLFHHIS